jgi:cysteine synthase A
MSLVSSSSSTRGALGAAQVGACLLLVVAGLTMRRRRRRKGDDEQQKVAGAGLTAQARLIGGTPMLRLESLSDLCGCEFLAKAEHLNPSGTGKDRIALEMILRAERKGHLPCGGGGVVVEGSSGSTVLSLAPLAVAAGHSLVAVVPDDVSAEKVAQLRATPEVRVVITRASAISSPSHYVNVARRIARELLAEGKKAVFMDQFETPANFDAHYHGTGLEILDQTKRLDAFVMSAGQFCKQMLTY